MTFTIVATATAIAGLVLGIGWLIAGDVLHKRWRMEPSAPSLLVGRRLGAAYVGISIMLLLGRSASRSDLRTAVCIGMLVALAILAGLGLRELIARRVGPGILVSVVLEVLLIAGFGWVLLTQDSV